MKNWTLPRIPMKYVYRKWYLRLGHGEMCGDRRIGFVVYDKKAKKSKTLYLPPRQYHSVSDILYGLNSVLAVEYYSTCDMFYYYNRLDPKSEIVFYTT